MSKCKKCELIQKDIEELRCRLIEETKVVSGITSRLWEISHKKY